MAKSTIVRFDTMWQEFPNPGESASAAKKTVGGNVDAAWIANTCVIRVSRAFNYSGQMIPGDHDGLLTVRGGDHLRYALRVKEFTKYLRAVYGRPAVSHTYSQPGGEVPPDFTGRQGVICFEVDGWDDATGHVDLWNGHECVHAGYFNRASKVFLWEAIGDGATPSRAPKPVHRIKRSVGQGGANRNKDVAVVQVLLRLNGVDPGRVDGVCSDDTIDAITTFQMRFLRRPDGRVDVDGRTWKELNNF